MKYIKKDVESKFKPFSIELLFETQRDVEIWKRFLGNMSQSDIADMCNSANYAHDDYERFNSDETKAVTDLYNNL